MITGEAVGEQFVNAVPETERVSPSEPEEPKKGSETIKERASSRRGTPVPNVGFNLIQMNGSSVPRREARKPRGQHMAVDVETVAASVDQH